METFCYSSDLCHQTLCLSRAVRILSDILRTGHIQKANQESKNNQQWMVACYRRTHESLATAESALKLFLKNQTKQTKNKAKETQLCSPHNRLETILRVHIHLSVSVPGNAVALAYSEVTSSHFDLSPTPTPLACFLSVDVVTCKDQRTLYTYLPFDFLLAMVYQPFYGTWSPVLSPFIYSLGKCPCVPHQLLLLLYETMLPPNLEETTSAHYYILLIP